MAPHHSTGRAFPIALMLAIIAAVLVFSPNFHDHGEVHQSPYGGDFLQEWIGGYFVRSGQRDRFYDPTLALEAEHNPTLVGHRWKADSYLPMVYPPFYYLLVSPFSWIPFKAAAVLWACLMTACLLVAFRLFQIMIAKASPPDSERLPWLRHAVWLMPLAVLYSPLLECLSSGQKSTLVLLLFAATFLLLRQKRPFIAGCVFALVAFKPQLTLVVALSMLFKRQWRFVMGGAAVGGLLVALSFLVGTDVCRQYLEFSLGTGDYMANTGYDLHKSHCLFGFFGLLFRDTNGLLVKSLSVGTGLIVLVLLRHQLRGPLEFQSDRFRKQFTALVLATILLSPHLFTYDLTLLLLAMFLLLPTTKAAMTAVRPVTWILLAGLFWLPALSVSLAATWGLQLTVPAMLALLWLVGRQDEKRTSFAGFGSALKEPAILADPVRPAFPHRAIRADR